METYEAILTRRSIREWTDQEIEKTTILKILHAGRHAPSPLNSQPWHFVVVRKKDSIAQLAFYAHHGSFISHAGALIVVSVEKKACIDEWLTEHLQHTYSGACAVENMWLATWDMGLGGCWVTLDDRKAKEFLEIPDDRMIVGCLAIGHIKGKSTTESIRHDLSEMISYEKFEKIGTSISRFTGRICKIIEETANVRTLIIEKPKDFLYRAGQYCLLSFPDKREIHEKKDVPMSISSSPVQENISFTIKNMGGFTNALFALGEGDALDIVGPIGHIFHFDEETKGDFVFLSGGTGIVPLISILRFIVEKEMRNTVIALNGNKNFESIIFRKELNRLTGWQENIKIVNTLDESDKDWQGERGFIDKEMILKHVNNPLSKHWFLCGPPPMVHGLKAILLEMGVEEEKIRLDDWELPKISL